MSNAEWFRVIRFSVIAFDSMNSPLFHSKRKKLSYIQKCHVCHKHTAISLYYVMNNLMITQCQMQIYLMNILWICRFDLISFGYFNKIQFSNGLNQTLQAKTNSQLNDLIRGEIALNFMFFHSNIYDHAMASYRRAVGYHISIVCIANINECENWLVIQNK